MKLRYTLEEIEKWRDRVHRRIPSRAVRSRTSALAFIKQVGFCFAFKSVNSELPCLWHAAWGGRDPDLPRNTHTDPLISFVWEMKDVLPAAGLVYYGRVLKRRPTFVSLEFFPYFFALTERSGTRVEYERAFRRGDISPSARSIMEALVDSSPQLTRGLRLAVGMSAPRDRAEFDRAIAELQMRMYIVKTAEQYNPFSFEWDLVHKVFARQIRRARRISTQEARCRILEQYFRNQLITSPTAIGRLFGWGRQEVFQALGSLVHTGVITPDVAVEGKRNGWYCLIH